MIEFIKLNLFDVVLPTLGGLCIVLVTILIFRIIGVVIEFRAPFLKFLEPTKFGRKLIGAWANKEIVDGDYDKWRSTARGEFMVRRLQILTVLIFLSNFLLLPFLY